jgi:S-adenosylmethionine:tRNA ribosyltransferase-isomerase
VEHRRFYELPAFLRAGDLLVTNNTRVLPAKLMLRKVTGAAIPGLFVEEKGLGVWEVMLRTRGKVRVGDRRGATGYEVMLEARLGEGMWRVRVAPAEPAAVSLQKIGAMPVPPYIEKARREGAREEPWEEEDRGWYQTVFATGVARSVAAPTAGLHFTGELLGKLEAMGVERAAVELEVGLGTFLPVETATLEEHVMHVERYRVPAGTVAALRAARGEGLRIVVVGTTAVRTLESAALKILVGVGPPTEISGETELKIGPGYRFRLVDALITNFHLPRSTLMALVAAFLGKGGVERLKGLYGEAIKDGYRFYSYGDAMMIG